MPLDFATDLPDSRELILGHLITQESAANAIQGVWASITGKTINLVRSMMPQLMELDEKTEVYHVRTSEYKTLLKLMKDFSFMTYADTLVTVPEGFIGHYDEFLHQLCITGAEIALKAPKVVDDYTMELTLFLSSDDARKALKSHDAAYKKIEGEREQMYKTLRKYIDPKAPTRSRIRISAMMDRFQDMENIFHQAERLEDLRKDISYKQLLSKVTKASELLSMIKTKYSEGDLTTISKEAIKGLANGAYEVAEYIELVATYGYLVEAALGSTKALSEQMTALFTRK